MPVCRNCGNERILIIRATQLCVDCDNLKNFGKEALKVYNEEQLDKQNKKFLARLSCVDPKWEEEE